MQFPSDRNRSAETPAQPCAQSAGVQKIEIEKDTVRLTENGRNVHSALQRARLLPEIREDRVMRLKRQIEEGAYCIKGDRIAANMISETLENNSLLKKIDTNA
jgi:flagellar biosynthesis anti-sigma factor FlgM